MGCGVKVKILEGIVVKIDGNFYSLWTLWLYFVYEIFVKEMVMVEGCVFDCCYFFDGGFVSGMGL